MNYFEHHIGDYAQATAHLSPLEDGTYHRLLRKYYADEKPLPVDVKAIQRLVAARTKDEKQAVVDMLNEFFVLAADGWHQDRCDREIVRYQEKRASAQKSAKARWDASERNADASLDECKTLSDGNANASDPHAKRNAHQTPDTKHQTPVKDKTKADAFVLPAWIPQDAWEAWMPIRKAKKASNSPFALGLIVKTLEQFRAEGIDVEGALHASIKGGWSDVYRPRANGQHSGKQAALEERNRSAGLDFLKMVESA